MPIVIATDQNVATVSFKGKIGFGANKDNHPPFAAMLPLSLVLASQGMLASQQGDVGDKFAKEWECQYILTMHFATIRMERLISEFIFDRNGYFSKNFYDCVTSIILSAEEVDREGVIERIFSPLLNPAKIASIKEDFKGAISFEHMTLHRFEAMRKCIEKVTPNGPDTDIDVPAIEALGSVLARYSKTYEQKLSYLKQKLSASSGFKESEGITIDDVRAAWEMKANPKGEAEKYYRALVKDMRAHNRAVPMETMRAEEKLYKYVKRGLGFCPQELINYANTQCTKILLLTSDIGVGPELSAEKKPPTKGTDFVGESTGRGILVDCNPDSIAPAEIPDTVMEEMLHEMEWNIIKKPDGSREKFTDQPEWRGALNADRAANNPVLKELIRRYELWDGAENAALTTSHIRKPDFYPEGLPDVYGIAAMIRQNLWNSQSPYAGDPESAVASEWNKPFYVIGEQEWPHPQSRTAATNEMVNSIMLAAFPNTWLLLEGVETGSLAYFKPSTNHQRVIYHIPEGQPIPSNMAPIKSFRQLCNDADAALKEEINRSITGQYPLYGDNSWIASVSRNMGAQGIARP